MSYNIPLDSSGDVDFTGTISASFFVGDGSQLTNLPSAINGVDETGDYTWTGDHTFNGGFNAVDGDFSGDITVGIGGRVNWGNTATSMRRSGTSLYWSIGGLTALTAHCGGSSKKLHWNEIENQDIDFKVGYNGGTGIDMDGATGSVTFGADVIANSGGSYKLYNLGTEGDTDTEHLAIETISNQFYIYPKKTGSGSSRDFYLRTVLGSTGAGIKLAANGTGYLQHGSNTNLNWGNGYIRPYVKFEPATDGTIPLGDSSLRWSNTYSVNGDFSGILS